MMTSPDFFYFLVILVFWVVKGGGGEQKMAQNDKKIVSHCISGIVAHMIVVFGTHV